MNTKSLLATTVAMVNALNFKWLFTCFLTFLIINQVYCQQRQQPTTELEYNYVTNGYRSQFAQGLDIKQGYSLKEIQHGTSNGGTATFKALNRIGETKPCAIMIIVETKTQGTKYLCIPSYDADIKLWEKFEKSLDDNFQWVASDYKLVLTNLAALQMKSYATK